MRYMNVLRIFSVVWFTIVLVTLFLMVGRVGWVVPVDSCRVILVWCPLIRLRTRLVSLRVCVFTVVDGCGLCVGRIRVIIPVLCLRTFIGGRIR